MARKKSKEKRYFWLKLKEDWFSGVSKRRKRVFISYVILGRS